MKTITPSVLTPSALGQLSDQDLMAHVHLAAGAERQATAHLVALLMELDVRRLYLREGFSSLFSYCTQALHQSEGAAYNRIETARAARCFPIILDLLREGEVTLRSIRLLAPHLTPDNHREVLARARHQSKRDVERLVATLHPRPDVPPTIRKLPASRVVTPPAPEAGHHVSATDGDAAVSVVPPRDMPAQRPAHMKPLAPERYKIQFTVSRGVYEKLRHWRSGARSAQTRRRSPDSSCGAA